MGFIVAKLTNNYKTGILLLIRQFRREHNLKEDSLRNRKKLGGGKSVKVRDLPEDRSRTVSIGIESAGLTTAEEIVFRARRGVPLAAGERIEFRGQDFDYTRRRLDGYTARVFAHHRRNNGHRS
jgi:hypothetical protein